MDVKCVLRLRDENGQASQGKQYFHPHILTLILINSAFVFTFLKKQGTRQKSIGESW
jgi:hypothetical protein